MVPTGNGKNTVYLIDVHDVGNKNPGHAGGKQIMDALLPAPEDLFDVGDSKAAVKDLGTSIANTGRQVDVLVVGDHAYVSGTTGTGVQACGDGKLNPAQGQSGLLDQIAGFVRRGGTLVLTGCNLFNERTIGMWQAYATAHGITIIGSASSVNSGKSGCTGVWVVLAPGGTPPTINNAD